MNQSLRTFLLWITVPLSIALAITGLAAFWPGIYWQITPLSATGAMASDILDLFVIVPVLVIAAVLARRGSLSALLVWAGTLGFLAYNFVIYALEVHFNPMFPAYCAVLGLSFYGLIGIREFFPVQEVAAQYRNHTPRKSIAVTFILLAATAAAGELKEIVAAIRAGQAPPSIVEGQFTNPIHVLDLCFLLPAVAIAAVLLLRRKDLGFTLAPALAVTLILISFEVITIVALTIKRGLGNDFSPAISFAVPAAILLLLLGWYFHPKHAVRFYREHPTDLFTSP